MRGASWRASRLHFLQDVFFASNLTAPWASIYYHWLKGVIAWLPFQASLTSPSPSTAQVPAKSCRSSKVECIDRSGSNLYYSWDTALLVSMQIECGPAVSPSKGEDWGGGWSSLGIDCLPIPGLHKPSMVMHAYNPSSGELKARGSEVQGHPQPWKKFEDRLGYSRPFLKTNETSKQQQQNGTDKYLY